LSFGDSDLFRILDLVLRIWLRPSGRAKFSVLSFDWAQDGVCGPKKPCQSDFEENLPVMRIYQWLAERLKSTVEGFIALDISVRPSYCPN
jgi:hypothetical protein